MNADDKIRAILRMEADTVDPSPAGWDAIQQGVASRRARPWWTTVAALAGAAAVFAGVAAYVASEDRPGRGGLVPTSPGPGGSASATATATAAPPPATPTATPSPVPPRVAAPPRPIGAIWPLTTTTEVEEWQADPEALPALKTSRGAALAFARRYLGLPEATVEGASANGVSGLEVKNGSLSVTQVTVQGFGKDGTAPFVVTAANGASVVIASPRPRLPLDGVFDARGTYEAVDPVITVALRSDGPGTEGASGGGTVRAETGPQGWSARLSAAGRTGTGSLLVTVPSGRDGSVASASAIPVTFGKLPGPDTFVAARGGRIAVVTTATGEVARWLTEAAPGAGASDPELSADGKTVVYVRSTGTCASEIRAVPVAGGPSETLVRDGAARLAHPSRRGDLLAYRRTRCADGGTDTDVVVRVAGRVVETASGDVVNGPVAGARYVAYVVTGPGGGEVRIVDARGGTREQQVAAAAGCGITAAAWGPDAEDAESLYVATGCEGYDDAQPVFLEVVSEKFGRTVRMSELAVEAPVDSLDYGGGSLLVGAGPVAYVVDEDATHAHQVSDDAQRPTW